MASHSITYVEVRKPGGPWGLYPGCAIDIENGIGVGRNPLWIIIGGHDGFCYFKNVKSFRPKIKGLPFDLSEEVATGYLDYLWSGAQHKPDYAKAGKKFIKARAAQGLTNLKSYRKDLKHALGMEVLTWVSLRELMDIDWDLKRELEDFQIRYDPTFSTYVEDLCKSFRCETIPKLKEIGKPDDVRLTLWFTD